VIAAVPVLAVLLAMASDGRRLLRPRFVQRMDELHHMAVDAGAIVPVGSPRFVDIRQDALEDWLSALVQTRDELREAARGATPVSHVANAWRHADKLVGVTADLVRRVIAGERLADTMSNEPRNAVLREWSALVWAVKDIDRLVVSIDDRGIERTLWVENRKVAVRNAAGGIRRINAAGQWSWVEASDPWYVHLRDALETKEPSKISQALAEELLRDCPAP
jgi:hypothetical protein